jgi:hypothetical protein
MPEFDDSILKRLSSLEKNISVLNDTLSKRLIPGAAAVHANSGPTGHSNVPGHANFTKVGFDRATHVGVKDVGAAAVHANSGPTGHSNVPGHANFDQQTLGGVSRLKPIALDRFGRLAAHANSGPTGHSNVPGHANFTKVMDELRDVQVTLPDGTRVTLDANSPASITVNGFQVTRKL